MIMMMTMVMTMVMTKMLYHKPYCSNTHDDHHCNNNNDCPLGSQ